MSRRSVFTVVLSLLLAAVPTVAFSSNNQPVITHQITRVCSLPNPGEASCLAWQNHFFVNGAEVPDLSRLNDAIRAAGGFVSPNKTAPAALPAGLSPANLKLAYKVNNTGFSTTGTVAIVDVYDPRYANSQYQTDLNTYCTTYSLSCSGTVKVLSQSGSTNISGSGSRGWAIETDLDIQMVKALCPACNINLYLASSASFGNLSAAVNTAAASGAFLCGKSY